MRQGWALVLGLLAAALVGCATNPPARTGTWLDRLLRPAAPSGPDVVQMDVALIERPLGDNYLNGELWIAADEQVVSLDNKAVLEDNGFRIGQIGGITPVGFQTLLTSERSCVNPRRLYTQAGKPSKLVLGPEMAECRFQLRKEGEPQPVTVALAKTQCTLEVTPSLTADGRTRLHFVPQLFHGDTSLLPRPTADLSGWMLKEERATERYTQFAWEVTLAPNEFVIVGGRFDKPDSLGCQCFLRGDEPTPIQRLLVIRTSRARKDIEGPGAVGDDALPPAIAPIASRASLTTARGSGR